MSTPGDEERITFHEGFDGLPVFSPDGKRLMWTSSGRTADHKSQLFIADFTMKPAAATGREGRGPLNRVTDRENERRQPQPRGEPDSHGTEGRYQADARYERLHSPQIRG